jgi:GNAT superfamily N-acetyltransferase
MAVRLRIEKLRRDHLLDGFDCGRDELNRFLIKHALQSQQGNASQIYLAIADERVVGFYTLVVGSVEWTDAPERVIKGLGRYPVPLMVLARLGVSVTWQGKGLGAGLLKDVMLRTLQAADIAGIRALAAHAKDDQARAFYERHDFIPAPTDPYHMFLLLKDIKNALQGS